ncbi:MAG TPA: YkgJ family cysteine cluster protein [Polyangiaceae bacterium]|nr:YkgJ family cysteine cluster protein [Polyangiaceae bacterium]
MTRSAPSAAEGALLEELAALYRQADAELDGASCPSSTECCRFGVTGREPYVTSIEVAALRRAVARRGGPLSAKRRALPLAANAGGAPRPAAVKGERVCAFLDVSGRCSVYESRPLGCRTFYCARATLPAKASGAGRRELVNRLRDIASRHEPGGDRARPLSKVFPT